MLTEAKLWPLEGEQGFKEIWPSDLVFDRTWPIFDFVLDIIKTNIPRYNTFYEMKGGGANNGHSVITIAHLEHFEDRWTEGRKLYTPSAYFICRGYNNHNIF